MGNIFLLLKFHFFWGGGGGGGVLEIPNFFRGEL